MRCIKPNELKSPILFDQARCQHQVAYLGLLENVMVRRAGFAYRQTYARFLQRWVMGGLFTCTRRWPRRDAHLSSSSIGRYKMTCEFTWPQHLMASDRDAVATIVQQHGFQDDVAYGNSKLFVRTPRTLFTLEQERAVLIPILVLFLQKVRPRLG